ERGHRRDHPALVGHGLAHHDAEGRHAVRGDEPQTTVPASYVSRTLPEYRSGPAATGALALVTRWHCRPLPAVRRGHGAPPVPGCARGPGGRARVSAPARRGASPRRHTASTPWTIMSTPLAIASAANATRA